jgi:hypothetical protein
LALAEIARLEGALSKKEAARKHLEGAIAALRSSAPSPVAVRAKIEELAQKAVPSERRQVRTQLKLRNDDEVRKVLDVCQKNCKELLAAAESRFALQTQILITALDWDDAAHLWQTIGPRAVAEAGENREPYFDTIVPWQLTIKLQHAGDKATADKIREAAGSAVPPTSAVLELLAQKVVDTADVNAIARQMQSQPRAERSDRERAAFAGSSYLLHAGKVGDAFQFVRMLDDSLLKEESLQWTAALACRLNFTRQTKETLKAASFIPTEAVSAWRGFLLGLLARDVAPDTVPPADTTGKPHPPEAKQL